MGLFIIATVLIVVVLFIFEYRCGELMDVRDWISGFILNLLGGATLGLIVAIVGSMIAYDTVPMTEQETGTWQISSLQDNMNAQEHFGLFMGYVDEDLYIYYVAHEYDGSKSICRVNREQCRIIETNSEEPHITWTKKIFENKFARWFFLEFGGSRAYMTVPKGTIYEDYNIDLR